MCFGLEGGKWEFIVLVPDHCLSFYFLYIVKGGCQNFIFFDGVKCCFFFFVVVVVFFFVFFFFVVVSFSRRVLYQLNGPIQKQNSATCFCSTGRKDMRPRLCILWACTAYYHASRQAA